MNKVLKVLFLIGASYGSYLLGLRNGTNLKNKEVTKTGNHRNSSNTENKSLFWYNAMQNVKNGIYKDEVVRFKPNKEDEEEFYQYSGATNELYVQVKAHNKNEAYDKLISAFIEFDETKKISWLKERK